MARTPGFHPAWLQGQFAPQACHPTLHNPNPGNMGLGRHYGMYSLGTTSPSTATKLDPKGDCHPRVYNTLPVPLGITSRAVIQGLCPRTSPQTHCPILHFKMHTFSIARFQFPGLPTSRSRRPWASKIRDWPPRELHPRRTVQTALPPWPFTKVSPRGQAPVFASPGGSAPRYLLRRHTYPGFQI